MPGLIAAQRPSLSVGGLLATIPTNMMAPKNPDGFFTLWTEREGSSTDGASAFTKVGGAAAAIAYQVTAGKTLKVYAIAYACSASGFNLWQFVTSTAAFGGGGAGPTSPVYQFGGSARYAYPALAANTWYQLNFGFQVAASLYFGIQAATVPATSVVVLCREE